uniref:Uncharacterized protein n=1 Tax=Anopheles melas TaxID=34690 RepID=A0A182UB79_9DIPT
MACESVCCAMLLVLVLAIVSPGVQSAGRPPFRGRREPPRTLQMIGSVNPRMLHKISADLQPDTSKVVHIQVPYYVDRPKQRPKKFQPWVLPPRNQRFASSGGGPPHHHFAPVQQQLHHPGPVPPFGGPFREAPFKAKPILPNEFLASPGPYDTPFVPVMKPSPVNPLPVEPAPPEIAFEPISILPLESPSFDTVRNHVRYLKQKQAAFFEGQGREFGLAGGGSVAPEELAYYGVHGGGTAVHNGDPDRDSERNTLSEHDFGQNDRKYDRRGKAHEVQEEEEEGDGEEDFYDAEGKQYRDDDFEDSRDEADRVAAFEPKKVYTQVRHREVVRHVPRSKEPEKEDEEEDHEEDQEDQDEQEDPKQSDDEDDEEEEEDEDHQERHTERRPIRERINLQRKNVVYSEKGRQAHKFDHGSEESFGEFEENEKAKPKRRNRIKRSLDDREEPGMLPVQQESNRTSLVDVLAMMILGNDTLPPHAEALTDPRELHGEELIRFLDEAIQNTTQYLPDKRSDGRTDVISIVSPPSNVVKFPYYTRPASEIDVDSALRYAENLTSFSNGLYGTKTSAGIECNEVDVELEEEPEPIEQGAEGFKPIRRLKGLGDRIDCLKRKHFGSEPLDNPLFREEFVGVPRKMYVPKGTTPAVPQQQQTQPNPAVAVYNDVIRHIKKHLASQQRRKSSKSDTEQDTLMIAVPRVLRLDRNDAQPASSGVHLKREARLVFPQANPLPLSNHISVPIFDISKFVPRFMMRPNDDLYSEDLLPAVTVPTTTPAPRLSSPMVRLQTLVRTAEQLAEGAVEVEESVEKILLTTQRTPTGTVRDDIADAFDDVLTKPNQPPAPLPPIKPYSVVEQDASGPPEPTFNKSGPPYAALALEPPVAQSILKQRIAPLERNRLDAGKTKRSPVKMRKPRRPTVTRKKVLVFYT